MISQSTIIIRHVANICIAYMTSEIEHVGLYCNIPNAFLNPIRVWQNYLIDWIQVSTNFYENAIRTNEQWLKALWFPWLKAGNPSQRETVKIE
jgi:hypothetical protein